MIKVTYESVVKSLMTARKTITALTADNNRMMTVINQANDELKHLRTLHTEAVNQAHDALDEVDELKALQRYHDSWRDAAYVGKSDIIDPPDCTPKQRMFDLVFEPNMLPGHIISKVNKAHTDKPSPFQPAWIDNKPLEKKQAEDRMANVVRLANAAIRHLKRNRPAIAIQLLKPLAGGQHDTYK